MTTPAPTPAVLIAAGQKHLDAGSVAAAELIARDVLLENPTNADAMNLLGRSQLALGVPAFAAQSFEHALRLNPYLKPAAKNLKRAQNAIAAFPLPPTNPRYVVIREWMEGLWSDVDHVIGLCAFADATGRLPIVHWGAQSRYRTSTPGNAWTEFFEPVSTATIADAAAHAASIFPPRWTRDSLTGPIAGRWSAPNSRVSALDLLGRTEDIVVSDFHSGISEMLPYLPPGHPLHGKSIVDARRIAVARYLRPVPAILHAVDEFQAAHFGSGPMLGVHLRGTDKVGEQPDLAAINSRYPAAIAHHLSANPTMRMLLITDSQPFVEFCNNAYPGRVITTAATRATGSVALHYMQGDHNRAALGAEVLIDTLLASRCDRFIGLATSNVSLYVRDFKHWPPGTAEFFGQAINDRRNLYIKLCPPPKET